MSCFFIPLPFIYFLCSVCLSLPHFPSLSPSFSPPPLFLCLSVCLCLCLCLSLSLYLSLSLSLSLSIYIYIYIYIYIHMHLCILGYKYLSALEIHLQTIRTIYPSSCVSKYLFEKGVSFVGFLQHDLY